MCVPFEVTEDARNDHLGLVSSYASLVPPQVGASHIIRLEIFNYRLISDIYL
jgi:hypothetical protein